ncbi:MAG: hypothetical protein ACHQ1H_05625 [Nitrososphaerales archaeon]
MIGRIVRAVVSLLVGIVPLLYLGGYLSFLYQFGIPTPASIFNLSGATGGSSAGLLSYSGYNILPFGAFGATGLIAFSILSRVGSTVSSAVAPRSNFGNMQSQMASSMFMNPMQSAGFGSMMPDKKLPEDITASQFVILKQARMGNSKPKSIAKNLSMDKKDVENHLIALKTNGYLSGNSKVTTKGMDLLSS